MTLNNSSQSIIDHRRRRVAHYRLRGYTQREIVNALEAEGSINTTNGTPKPWALGTINGDLKAIEESWRVAARRDIAEHKANMLAELREAARAAWKASDLNIVLRSLKQQAELLGLDEPQEIKHNDFLINVIYGDTRTNGQSETPAPETG